MNRYILHIALFLVFALRLQAQTGTLYDDTRIASIYLTLPADSLQYMINNLINTRYLRADFVFVAGTQRDTLHDVGLRLRGNTSLWAQKKSFRISIDEFVPDRNYQGVDKLNLRGQQNDPSMVREKLFYEIWNKSGMPPRRAAFTRLYINGNYRGLYTNIEEMDKSWLDRTFDDDSGNLFKCTWPASLQYLGPDQNSYKNIYNNPLERAYDLKTNEDADDYSRLVALITALNQPVNAAFPDNIRQIIDVDNVLKAFAIDVLTGNWDDYFYNKNNYYLYDDPSIGKFRFITFDTDNTFGIDWLNKDWGTRDCLQWLPEWEVLPLAHKLMQVPEFKDQYIRHLDTLTRFIAHPDTIFPRIDFLRVFVSNAAANDPYRGLDFGYTYTDFVNSFTQAIDAHTTYGIKPFLSLRCQTIRDRIAGMLSAAPEPEQDAATRLTVFPNPLFGAAPYHISWADGPLSPDAQLEWYTATGQRSALNKLPSGLVLLHVRDGAREGWTRVLKMD